MESEIALKISRVVRKPLFDHQLRAVMALLEYENQRVESAGPVYTESTAAILADQMGGGKTLSLLSLIACRVQPTASLIYCNMGRTNTVSHEIRADYSDKIIDSNLVVVGASVVSQWKSEIEKFTNLRCIVVSQKKEFLPFAKMYRDGTLPYDIVLVKNGEIAGEGGESKISLVAAISRLTAGRAWLRAVYDDYDTAKPTNVVIRCVRAMSSIFVSTTNKRIVLKEPTSKSARVDIGTATAAWVDALSGYKPESNPFLALLGKIAPRVDTISHDRDLCDGWLFRNNPDIVQQSMCLPIVETYLHRCHTASGNIILMLKKFGTNDATKYAEMIGADSMKTLANELALDSPGEFLGRFLLRQTAAYNKAIRIVERATAFLAYAATISQFTYTGASTTDVIESLIGSTSAPSTVSKVKTPEMIAAVSNLADEKRAVAAAIVTGCQAMMDVVRCTKCIVCRGGVTNTNVIVRGCCGSVICAECIESCDNISCGGCSWGICETSNLHLKAGSTPEEFMFISNMVSWECYDGRNVKLDAAVPVVDGTDEPTVTKIQSLKAIIDGEEVGDVVDRVIPGVLHGTRDSPTGYNRLKITVFAGYSEALTSIENMLVEAGILFIKLAGTPAERAKIVEQFRTTYDVLLVNSGSTCAGLNLQFMTDLVFFHKIADGAVETQVVGRGQRIGRDSNLRVHWLLYDSEQ